MRTDLLAIILALAAMVLSSGVVEQPPLAAETMTQDDKWTFAQAMCEGLEREQRCLSFAKVTLDLRLNWVIFEACSFSGQREAILKCFDRAMNMAAELTGDPQYDERYAYCHRFEKEDADLTDLIVRCYREGFKYSQEFIEDKYKYQQDQ